MSNKVLLSIVSPVYKAEGLVDVLVSRIINCVEKITHDFEIILIDDCGPDNSWQKIQENCAKDTRVTGIKLSRNFGQHYAITAGLDASKGDWVVVMDCDLQDKPEEISKLFTVAQQGFDVVLAQRFNRQDNFLKRMTSKSFYSVLSYLTGTRQDSSVANYGIYHRKVIDAICSMRESIRYFPTMVRWVGFKTTSIKVEHAERLEGETSYNLKRLLNLALDIILAYSDKPLRITVKTGLFISVISFVIALIMVVKAFLGDFIVMGYASLMVSIWFFFGLTISILGIIGLYLGKTFEGVKARPIYIISEFVNFKEN